MINIQDHDCTPKAGSYLIPDGWAAKIGGTLVAADADAQSLGAEFRLPSLNHRDIQYPIKVKVTGRTINRPSYGTRRVRVEITWVHDGEPNTTGGGWMYV